MSEATRFRESLDAQQLADALRTRYTARREQPDDDELSADLRRLGDIEAIPAVAKPGVTAGPMKAARAVLRVLLRPWLAVQTQTNHAVARRLQDLSSHVGDLLRRTPDVEESLQHLDARLREIERRAVSSPSALSRPPGPDGSGLRSAESGPADLERMFVHMHLGRPPARVLVLGSTASVVGELAAFGFEVSRDDQTEATANPDASATVPVRLPFGDSAFDAVIALPDSQGRQAGLEETAGETARVLRAGGMLVGAWRIDALSGATSAWSTLFEPRVVMIGEPFEGGWQVREQTPMAASVASLRDPRSTVMMQALRLDAPGR